MLCISCTETKAALVLLTLLFSPRLVLSAGRAGDIIFCFFRLFIINIVFFAHLLCIFFINLMNFCHYLIIYFVAAASVECWTCRYSGDNFLFHLFIRFFSLQFDALGAYFWHYLIECYFEKMGHHAYNRIFVFEKHILCVLGWAVKYFLFISMFGPMKKVAILGLKNCVQIIES